MAKDIVIKGANENNLKNIDVTIPRDRFVVLTGLSGSGNHPWPLILYMQRARGDIWRAFLRMPDNFWGRWRNRM